MQTLTKRVLVMVALLAAVVGGSVSQAQRTKETREVQKHYRMSDLVGIESVDAQMKGTELVGLTARLKSGRSVPLKLQSSSNCDRSCPSNQTLSCWEDEQQSMSICVCISTTGLTGNRIAPPFTS
jgi:hypothetical protein